MRLPAYSRLIKAVGPTNAIICGVLMLLAAAFLIRRFLSQDLLLTLFYSVLYLIASPTAILVNKILMKDYGFGYPVLVSALGQFMTMILATVAVHTWGISIDAGWRVGCKSLTLLGGASALSLVLGQYPYLYLTVAFIQMLKAFSPAYMVVFLSCLGVEYPSRRVIACVLGLSICAAVASAGEVNFNLIGFLFMAGASCSDALRLVIAQQLLKNNKLGPIEALYYTSPMCILWMIPAALITEMPVAYRANSFALVKLHPMMFLASGLSGFFVNVTSFLLVKRTSSMTLKTMTMTRNGGLVLFSALLMGEEVTAVELVGYSGLLIFFTLYGVAKSQESSQPRPERAGKEDEYASVVPLMPAGTKGHRSPPVVGGNKISLREVEHETEHESEWNQGARA